MKDTIFDELLEIPVIGPVLYAAAICAKARPDIYNMISKRIDPPAFGNTKLILEKGELVVPSRMSLSYFLGKNKKCYHAKNTLTLKQFAKRK